MVNGISGASDLNRLVADLESAGKRIGSAASKAVRDSAGRVQKDAKGKAPKGKTLKLSESIGVDLYGAGRSSKGVTAVVGPSVRYGLFVEYGTAKMPPRPFMGPARAEEEPRFVAAMEALSEEVLP